MKTSQLKTLVKEAVKEAIQEELREILLEAVKSPKVVTESKDTYAQPNLSNPKQLTPQERKDMFSGILGEMHKEEQQQLLIKEILIQKEQCLVVIYPQVK